MSWARLRHIDGILQGHPDMRKTPGVDYTTGSLGNGLSIGVGMALAAKVDGRDFRTYVMLGCGEMQEGLVWEALMAGAKFKLDNLCAIVDYNRLQLDGHNDEVMPLGDLRAKLQRRSIGTSSSATDTPSTPSEAPCRRHARCRAAERHRRAYREGQGRLLHGRPCRVARHGAR